MLPIRSNQETHRESPFRHNLPGARPVMRDMAGLRQPSRAGRRPDAHHGGPGRHPAAPSLRRAVGGLRHDGTVAPADPADEREERHATGPCLVSPVARVRSRSSGGTLSRIPPPSQISPCGGGFPANHVNGENVETCKKRDP